MNRFRQHLGIVWFVHVSANQSLKMHQWLWLSTFSCTCEMITLIRSSLSASSSLTSFSSSAWSFGCQGWSLLQQHLVHLNLWSDVHGMHWYLLILDNVIYISTRILYVLIWVQLCILMCTISVYNLESNYCSHKIDIWHSNIQIINNFRFVTNIISLMASWYDVLSTFSWETCFGHASFGTLYLDYEN